MQATSSSSPFLGQPVDDGRIGICDVGITLTRGGSGRGTRIFQIYNHLLLHTIPPPKRVQISPDEGSILLAVSAFHNGQFPSISVTVTAYNVLNTTLFHKIQGRP